MSQSPPKLPRVTIEFCTQCKWMLRAAYFAQELLSTFSTDLGEVALQPSTGGTFVVRLYTAASSTSSNQEGEVRQHVLWDRKAEGGFPETKDLKRRVRDIIDPNRDLGHVDRQSSSSSSSDPKPSATLTPPERIPSGPAIPRAINRLQASSNFERERKFTPMDVDVDVKSRSVSRNEQGEVLNERGKIVIGDGEEDGMGGGFGFCRPGDEDCG